MVLSRLDIPASGLTVEDTAEVEFAVFPGECRSVECT